MDIATVINPSAKQVAGKEAISLRLDLIYYIPETRKVSRSRGAYSARSRGSFTLPYTPFQRISESQRYPIEMATQQEPSVTILPIPAQS